MRLFTCLIASLLLALPLQSAEPEPSFPATIDAVLSETEWVKLGDYRYIYRIFFKLYDVALYAPPNRSAQDVLNASTPFRLQFRYLREIDKAIILKSAQKMLERNLSDAQMEQIEDRVTRINEGYRTVEDGDHSALTFVPGEGTTLSINGAPVVTIEGSDFARLYFKIWLGETPLSTELRQSVLGLDG